MATKRLAKELGLLRQRSSSGSKKQLVSNQIFFYIIVIDFESTCWKEKNNYGQEIIEFPAVLLNTSTGEVESEFHTYVQPQEHPVLSDFCTELTGITQTQVEAGVPLQICLSRFSRWLQNLQHQKGVVFANRQQNTAQPSASQKLCTFLTWSDWDLGVCLQYECKRKQMNKPSVLNSWIDLRSTYRLFYNRKPKGLKGALQDLGIQFEGREHSGLDDARNTAQLAARMMRDGCVMRITRSLDRTPITNTKEPAEIKKPAEHNDENDKRISTFIKPSTSTSLSLNMTKSSVQNCQSLVSPKTLLNGTVLLREACKSATTSLNLPSITVNIASPCNNSITSSTMGCVPLLPPSQPNIDEGPFEKIMVEMEERCGSYDNVVLDDLTEAEYNPDLESYASEETIYSAKSFIATTSDTNETMGYQSELKTCFAVPKPVSNSKFHHYTKKESQTPFTLLNKSEINPRNMSKPQVLVPNTPSFHKPFPKHKPSKPSFSIYTDPQDPCTSTSHNSTSVSRSILSNLSTNTSFNRTSVGTAKGEVRITPPLCQCGRRAKRQIVSNGGPNQGRAFFCCPGRRSGTGGTGQKRCGFFKWEPALFRDSCMRGSAAVGSSVSLCQFNTTVNCQKGKSLRKSF